MQLGRILSLALLPASLFACVYSDEPPRRLAPEPHPYEASPPPSDGTGGTGGTTAEPPSSSPSPMLVEIDTDQTMSADPGQGVGVFIEYATGGHWHVWWTCDTAKTGQSCDFSVSAAAKSGNITNPDSSQLEGGLLATPDPSTVEAKVTTTNQVHAIRFDTTPGAIVTVKASLGGLTDGSYLFFVQDGKVNGGFTGRVTNPLQLQGKVP
jgi:hypothetical protein